MGLASDVFSLAPNYMRQKSAHANILGDTPTCEAHSCWENITHNGDSARWRRHAKLTTRTRSGSYRSQFQTRMKVNEVSLLSLYAMFTKPMTVMWELGKWRTLLQSTSLSKHCECMTIIKVLINSNNSCAITVGIAVYYSDIPWRTWDITHMVSWCVG